MSHIVSLFKDREGLTVLEYGLISFLISVATLAAVISIEYHLINLFPA